MGLDMDLYKKIYGSGEGTITLKPWWDENGKGKEVDLSKVEHVLVHVAYWRKANSIHGWIVRNCADGVDECQRIELNSGDLVRLRNICQEILDEPGATRDKKAAELLPPTEGFFFGSQEIGEGYYDDLRHTVEVLSDIKEDDAEYYEYQASW